MKKLTLGILNTCYGVLCSLLYLIRTGKIILWAFTEGNQYTQTFVTVWETALLVLFALSIVLFVLNTKRNNKGNKAIYIILNSLIALNGLSAFAVQGVTVFSFLIIILGAFLVLQHCIVGDRD